MKKKLIIGGSALALVAVAALAAIFVLGGRSDAAGEKPKPTPVHVEGKLGPHITLQDRVFNLASGPGGTKHFLKLQVAVEFETTDPGWFKLTGAALEKAQEEFEKDEIGEARKIVEDVVTNVVSGKRVEEISTTEGKDRLRAELRDAINERIHEPPVSRVLFTSFVTD